MGAPMVHADARGGRGRRGSNAARGTRTKSAGPLAGDGKLNEPNYYTNMNLLLLLLVLLLLFGGGGFYLGGPVYGGSGLGLVLLIVIIVYLSGGFRGKP